MTEIALDMAAVLRELARYKLLYEGCKVAERAAYKQGVAHARSVVETHYDWNPSTVRADLLLNIDMTCVNGPVTAEDMAGFDSPIGDEDARRTA